MSDARSEAAAIARAARRLVERERALGGAELLAAGVAAAMPAARAAVSGRGVATAPAPAEAPVSAAPASPATGAFALSPPEPAPAPAPAAAAPEPLPRFADDLWPSALGGGRDAIVASSRPVLDEIAAQARACTTCGLSSTRTNAVPGTGSAASGIVFVGEAPGADEDAQGEPFVGRAGQLLTDMIAGMHSRGLVPGVPLDRTSVYIVNVLKCRPPENRNPLPHEIESCSPFVIRQLEALQPRVICCLGKFAAELLIGVKGTIASMRGRTYRWRGAKLVVTYHPAYCLRSPSAKRPVWEDLQRLAQEYLTD
jgi:uracil-DNA glycosylase family 4